MDVKKLSSLGGKARAKALGKKGLSEAGRKAVLARWAKYRALKENSESSGKHL